MGTRSTVRFIEVSKEKDSAVKTETTICNIYQQFDGYPECVGMDLANFLAGIKLVNGIGSDNENIANGLGCLAAQYIKDQKGGAGGFYMTGPEDRQEYNYEILVGHDDQYNPLPVVIRLKEENFEGTPKEFIEKFSE